MKSYGETLLCEGLSILMDNCVWGLLGMDTPTVIEQNRPPWLKGLELDVYIPELALAFEYQGEQHYEMMNSIEFLKRFLYDVQKAFICRQSDIILVRINASSLGLRQLVRSIHYGLEDFYQTPTFNDEFCRVVKKIVEQDKKISCRVTPNNYSYKHGLIYKLLNCFDYDKDVGDVTHLYFQKVTKYRLDIDNLGLKNMNWNVGGNGPKFRKIATKMLDGISGGKSLAGYTDKMMKTDDIAGALKYATTMDY